LPTIMAGMRKNRWSREYLQSQLQRLAPGSDNGSVRVVDGNIFKGRAAHSIEAATRRVLVGVKDGAVPPPWVQRSKDNGATLIALGRQLRPEWQSVVNQAIEQAAPYDMAYVDDKCFALTLPGHGGTIFVRLPETAKLLATLFEFNPEATAAATSQPGTRAAPASPAQAKTKPVPHLSFDEPAARARLMRARIFCTIHRDKPFEFRGMAGGVYAVCPVGRCAWSYFVA
jgi:hypothetical protein